MFKKEVIVPLLIGLIPLAVVLSLLAQWRPNMRKERIGVPKEGKLAKSPEDWRKVLTREQFEVARLRGTERAFTGAYWNTKDDGIYQCICCGQSLFDSKTKYDSGT